jgi:hypothetical protein
MTRKTFSGLITSLKSDQIFVFGSNPEGRHGAGTAKIARMHYGAPYGKGRGLMGQSYALVTTNLSNGYHEKATGITYDKRGAKGVSSSLIEDNIKELYSTAKENKHLDFLVAYTAKGFNLNGYTGKEMAAMFASHKVPKNIVFEDKFSDLVFGT